MKCQISDCKNEAIWREIDRYIQPGQTHAAHPYFYFYYLCNKHKEKFDKPRAGHVKKFEKLTKL